MGIISLSGGSNVVLRPVIAGFAAIGAIVLAVFGEPHSILGMAKGAVPVALATFFWLIANRTDKYFSWHMRVLLLPSREAGEIASHPDRPQPVGRRGRSEWAGAADSATRHQTPDASYRQNRSSRSVAGTGSAQRGRRRPERTDSGVFHTQRRRVSLDGASLYTPKTLVAGCYEAHP